MLPLFIFHMQPLLIRLTVYAKSLKARVERWVGIPVFIGMPSKVVFLTIEVFAVGRSRGRTKPTG